MERLFPIAYRHYLKHARPRRLLEGAKPGPIVPITADYPNAAGPGPPELLARWLVPDAASVSGNMFKAMWPLEMKKHAFYVPMVKDGRWVFEFGVYLKKGHWVGSWQYEIGEQHFTIPTGYLYELDAAAARLKAELGAGTEVRPVIFVPSGLVFAVGDNRGQEAAVFLDGTRMGKGITDAPLGGPIPEGGELLTHEELVELCGGASQTASP